MSPGGPRSPLRLRLSAQLRADALIQGCPSLLYNPGKQPLVARQTRGARMAPESSPYGWRLIFVVTSTRSVAEK